MILDKDNKWHLVLDVNDKQATELKRMVKELFKLAKTVLGVWFEYGTYKYAQQHER